MSLSIRQVAPHADCLHARSAGVALRWTTLHITDGSARGTEAWFRMGRQERAEAYARKMGRPVTDPLVQSLSVPTCAHYMVCRSGEVVQFADEGVKVYHAANINSSSIGIEHEGFDERPEDLTAAQLEASAELVRAIHARHALPLVRGNVPRLAPGYIGHSDVPGTKKPCPGARFPWDRWEALVRAGAEG